MEWIEATGRTVDEAREQALDLLGADDKDVEFEVLDEGRPSFLGFGRREARVRARLRPKFPSPKRDRRRSRRKPGRGLGESDSRRGEMQMEAGGPGQRRSETLGDTQSGSEGRITGLSRVEVAARGQAFLAGLMQEFGLSGEIRVTSLTDDELQFDVEGDGLGVLVGSRGSVLGAIQELTRDVVHGAGGDGVGRVIVDVAGYRRKRREALERFAREQAEVARATGGERVLEPMTAADRKIIHDVVASMEGVGTRSEGEEPERYVVIYAQEQGDGGPVGTGGGRSDVD